MKIAYIYYLVQERQFGVEKKVRQQAQALQSEAVDIDLIVLNPFRGGNEGGITYQKLRSYPFPLNYYEYIFRRYQLIERNADLKRYDYVILRYPLADSTGPAFTHRHRVITEHNADEAAELQSRLRTAKSPIEKLARRIMLNHELSYATPTLKGCKGLIGVTDEITTLQEERAGGSVPALTIGNGVFVDGIPHTGFKPFDGESLDIAFLGASLRPWHGLERIVDSLNSYHGPVRVTLHIIGNISQDKLGTIVPDLDNVRFYGPKQDGELDEIMSNMNLAINSMAMYKRKLNETAALKLREYTARGLPFILANSDPDLSAIEERDRFFLTFENDDSLLDMERIIDFAEEVSRHRKSLTGYMRAYARSNMDWRVKLRQYLDFVNDIAARDNAQFT